MKTLWQTHSVAPGTCLRVRVDRLTLWIWRQPDEWRLAHRLDAPDTAVPASGLTTEEPPRDVSWVRFAGDGARGAVRLLPALPALPVVIRPADALNLLPGHTAPFFVGIPISVRVELPGHATSTVLAELPVQTLSKTWSGAPDDDAGLLCLALRSRARRHVSELDDVPAGRAVCALHVRNASSELFEFQRLALPTANLAVVQAGDGLLWTTPVEAVFQGQDHAARLRYDLPQPSAARDVRPLTPPRETAVESLSSRVFNIWRHTP